MSKDLFEGGKTSFYHDPNDNEFLVRHAYGVYMVVNLKTGMNEGWKVGNSKSFTYLGRVPQGIAGGAKSFISKKNIAILQRLVDMWEAGK